MCDYSLHAVKTREAKVGDELTVVSFSGGTRGFARAHEPRVATCLRPGTELSFDMPVQFYANHLEIGNTPHTTARFRKIEEDNPNTHHDALEFPDGRVMLLTLLVAGQRAKVLQLPVGASRRQSQSGRRARETEPV